MCEETILILRNRFLRGSSRDLIIKEEFYYPFLPPLKEQKNYPISKELIIKQVLRSISYQVESTLKKSMGNIVD
jgi:hypothetical protein